MGIKGLSKLIEMKAKSAITEREFADYENTVQAIDISLVLYKFIIAIRSSRKGKDLTRKDGRMTSHIHGIFNKFLSCLKYGILPYAVFDGKAPEIKSETLKERRRRKEAAIKKLKSVTDDEMSESERVKLYKRSFRLKEEHIKDIKKLLRLMGLRYIQAPGEADSQCAALNKKKKVYGVVTEDMDVLAFGAPVMLRNFTNKKKVIEIRLNRILKELELRYDQFVDICILLGSDYCKTIKGIGPMKAYEKYKQVGSIELLLKLLEKENKMSKKQGKEILYKIPKNYRSKWRQTKEYYMKTEVYEPEKIVIDWDGPDRAGLIEYLCKEHEFNLSTTTKRVNLLIEMYETYKKNNNTLKGGRRKENYRPRNRCCVQKRHIQKNYMYKQQTRNIRVAHSRTYYVRKNDINMH